MRFQHRCPPPSFLLTFGLFKYFLEFSLLVVHFVFRILFVVFSMHLWLTKVLLLLPEQWNKLKTLKLYLLPSQFLFFSFFVLSIYILLLSCFCLSYLPLYFIPQETLLLLLYTINIHLDLVPFLLLFISFCFSMLPSGIISLCLKNSL